MEELRKALAKVFRQRGKTVLTEKEFRLTVSMDLNWFSPDQARKMLKMAREVGLVREEEDGLRPSFDPEEEDIPLEFKPSDRILTRVEPPLFSKVVDAIVEATDIERTTVVARVNKKQERLNIDLRVVALMEARRVGVDIDPFLDTVEEHIVRTYALTGGQEEE